MDDGQSGGGFFGKDIEHDGSSLVQPAGASWRVGVALALAAVTLLAAGAAAGLHLQVSRADGCTHLRDVMALVIEQERQGQWAVAAANAETALANPSLCRPDREALASKAVLNGLEALYGAHPDPGDMAAQHAIVDRYEHIRDVAKAHDLLDLPALSAWNVSRRAYDAEEFVLCRHVLLAELGSDGSGITDRAQLRHYDDVTYNYGFWAAQSPSHRVRQEGLRLVRTAHELDKAYGLRSGKPRDYLQSTFGLDEAKWPAPAPDPLLDEPARVIGQLERSVSR